MNVSMICFNKICSELTNNLFGSCIKSFSRRIQIAYMILHTTVCSSGDTKLIIIQK